MDRRKLLTAAGLLAAAPAAPALAAAQPSLRGPYLDLTTGQGNMINKVRMSADLDETKQRLGGVAGVVTAVRQGEKLRDLVGFEVVSAGRAAKQPDGSYRFYHREVILYTDLATGEVLDTYLNPFTNERVKVVHVVNDPWNEHIEPYEPLPPNYGGLNKTEPGPRKPLIVPWKDVGGGMLVTMRNIHLYYRSALQPDQWPRESSGPMNSVSETYTTMVKLADVQNPRLTAIKSWVTWARTTPWLPWMLMGQAPGHIQYHSIPTGGDSLATMRPAVRAYMEKNLPHMLVAPPPESWSKPNLSSLEVYAATQKPAPPKS